MNLINAQVGLKRIQAFLQAEEMCSVTSSVDGCGRPPPRATSKRPLLDVRAGADALILAAEGRGYGGKVTDKLIAGDGDDEVALLLRNGFFSWGCNAKDKIVLWHINLRIRRGQLVMIVGQVWFRCYIYCNIYGAERGYGSVELSPADV